MHGCEKIFPLFLSKIFGYEMCQTLSKQLENEGMVKKCEISSTKTMHGIINS
jgi:hypothetical protein